jgi:hypothetical protein
MNNAFWVARNIVVCSIFCASEKKVIVADERIRGMVRVIAVRACNNCISERKCVSDGPVDNHSDNFKKLVNPCGENDQFVAKNFKNSRASRKFFNKMFVTFFALTAPASKSANPHCMKSTVLPLMIRSV